jgi:hypothetical protein
MSPQSWSLSTAWSHSLAVGLRDHAEADSARLLAANVEAPARERLILIRISRSCGR